MNIIRKGQGTFIKILSLAIGLTVGLVLIAKVQLERNYDCCIVDKEHVYELQETFQRKGQEPQQYGATSGGIAPALAREIPEIRTATRYTGQFSEEKLTLENGNRHFFEEAVFADSCFFDIFATKVLQGDAKRILSTAGQCIGLIGYVRDEVQRRSRELAIRKVMGATIKELQSLFLRSIAFIALPSIIFGTALGLYLSRLLMEQFSDKTPMPWYVFTVCALLVLCIIAVVVYIQTRRVANSNPVNYLKTE